MSTIVKINGHDIDLNNALPLTLGDWMELEKSGLTARTLSEGKVSDIVAMLHYVLHKANEQISLNDITSLSMRSIIIQQVMDAINEVQELDRPTLTPFTSLDIPTDGQSGT